MRTIRLTTERVEELERLAQHRTPGLTGQVSRRGWSRSPVLVVGEAVRLTPGEGVWLEVVRVTPCAAYLRSCVVREVTVTDRATGELRMFEARSSELVPVSRQAFVERKGV